MFVNDLRALPQRDYDVPCLFKDGKKNYLAFVSCEKIKSNVPESIPQAIACVTCGFAFFIPQFRDFHKSAIEGKKAKYLVLVDLIPDDLRSAKKITANDLQKIITHGCVRL